MKMGEPFETATCIGCQRLIRHIYWGNGGTIWEHFDGRGECAPTSRAKPTTGTVEAIDDCPVGVDGCNVIGPHGMEAHGPTQSPEAAAADYLNAPNYMPGPQRPDLAGQVSSTHDRHEERMAAMENRRERRIFIAAAESTYTVEPGEDAAEVFTGISDLLDAAAAQQAKASEQGESRG